MTVPDADNPLDPQLAAVNARLDIQDKTLTEVLKVVESLNAKLSINDQGGRSSTHPDNREAGN